jgi:hypothetical protein
VAIAQPRTDLTAPIWGTYRLDNLTSAVLTIGSPALAGYSLITTLLNSRWINRRFKQSVDYPNAVSAVSILSSLQQVPLRLHSGLAHFPSLVIRPENDAWWKCFAKFRIRRVHSHVVNCFRDLHRLGRCSLYADRSQLSIGCLLGCSIQR